MEYLSFSAAVAIVPPLHRRTGETNIGSPVEGNAAERTGFQVHPVRVRHRLVGVVDGRAVKGVQVRHRLGPQIPGEVQRRVGHIPGSQRPHGVIVHRGVVLGVECGHSPNLVRQRTTSHRNGLHRRIALHYNANMDTDNAFADTHRFTVSVSL